MEDHLWRQICTTCTNELENWCPIGVLGVRDELVYGWCSMCRYTGWTDGIYCPKCKEEGHKFHMWSLPSGVLAVGPEEEI